MNNDLHAVIGDPYHLPECQYRTESGTGVTMQNENQAMQMRGCH